MIARALAKDPADRYPSAGDLGRAALAAARGEPVTESERSVAIGPGRAGARRQRRTTARPSATAGRDRGHARWSRPAEAGPGRHGRPARVDAAPAGDRRVIRPRRWPLGRRRVGGSLALVAVGLALGAVLRRPAAAAPRPAR